MFGMRLSRLVGLFAISIVLGGCASSNPPPIQIPGPAAWAPTSSGQVVLAAGDVIEVSYFQSYSDSSMYRLEPGDVIQVIVDGTAPSSAYRLQPSDQIRLIIRSGVEQGPYQILPDGHCTLPLLGAVPIGGLTIDEATEELNKLYSGHYEKPSISLLVSPASPLGLTHDATILPDGTCTLPSIGAVTLKGMTIAEATSRLNAMYSPVSPHAHAEIIVVEARGRTRDFFETLRSTPSGADRKFELTEEGSLQLPLIPPVQALGRTLEDVRAEIRTAYHSALPDVSVTTTLSSRERRTFAIWGEVNHGGVFPVSYPMSIMEAVSLAGGLTDRARRSQIILIRPEPDGTVSIQSINLGNTLDLNGYAALKVAVQPHDLLFVPKSRIANLNLFVLQYIRGLLPLQVNAGLGWDLTKQ
jgi:polysaccharide export outer membrane protein